MKGRKLLLQEVLQLEDGCKVWAEELRTYMESNLYTINKRQEKMYDENNCYYWLDDLTEVDENKDAEFYEWIEDSDLIQIKSNVPIRCSTCYNLATEICNLRSLDLTDENIEMIIK